MAADRVLGIATVAFHDVAPVPLTRWLPLVLTLGCDLPLLIETPPCRSRVAVQSESASSARLRVRCFGGFEVTLDGRPLPRHAFARRKAWELLALLVAASGRPSPAAALAERLWPGVPPGRGSNRLHVTLSALRSVIEPGGRPWTHIRFQDPGFYLDPQSGVFVDVWRYDELRQRARSAEAQMRPVEEVAALLEEAVAIYTADPFESAVSADWVEPLAARYREDVLSALAELAALWRELGATARADRARERAARLDPGRRPGRGR